MDSQPLNSTLKNRVDKWRTFFSDPSPGQILCKITTWNRKFDLSGAGLVHRKLNEWKFPEDTRLFAENSVKRLRAVEKHISRFGIDGMPSIGPGIGIALHSLFFTDGDMIVDEHNSWSEPAVKTWKDMENLELSEHNRWHVLIRECCRIFLEMSDGDYTVHTFSHFGPSDLANALRGNDLFTDLYDSPDMLEQLLAKCADAAIWHEHKLRETVPPADGGRTIWGSYLPGEAVFMSEDAADLCAPATYAGLFRKHTERVARACGGCFIHHHMQGFAVHKEIVKTKGLRMIEISLDPNKDRPAEHLKELIEQNAGIPLMFSCTPDEVREHIDLLKQGRIFLTLDVGELDEAEEAIRFIRKHSKL